MHLQYWLSFYDKPIAISEELLSRLWQAVYGCGCGGGAAAAAPAAVLLCPVLSTPRRS